MKAKIIYIIATGCLCLVLASVAVGQDLIKSTQSGLNTVKKQSANLIAEQIATHRNTSNFAPVSLFTINNTQERNQYEDYVAGAVYLKLDSEAALKLSNLQEDYITLNIPVSDTKKFQVELMKVDILSDDFQMTTQDGRVIYSHDFPGTFYRGIIKGDPNSIVSFSVFENRIQGLISDDYGNYTLGKVENLSDSYILYNDKKLKVEHNFSCSVVDDVKPNTYPHYEEKSASGGDCIDIYIEADYATFQSHGSNNNNVASFVGALFNQVSTLYSNEGISIQISQLVVWTSPDPFLAYGNTLDVIIAFRQIRTSFNGNLAHLISTRSLGGGIAYLDVLCNNSYSYGVSAGLSASVVPIPTYSWNVGVFAHELGHNFGSPHTHSCAWNGNNTQIDDCGNYYLVNNGVDDNNNGTVDDASEAEGQSCYSYPNGQYYPTNGGTIMSYCHIIQGIDINFNLGFGQQPGDLIRNRYYNAACKNDCNCPVNLNITTTYNSGSNIDLEASNTITASNIINSGATVDYDAGTHIDLVNGFHARYGCDFHAFIDGCGGALIVGGNDNDDSTFDDLKQILKTTAFTADEVTLRNYPNPFTGTTTIEYTLPQAGKVSMMISDLSGQVMAHPLSDKLHEVGVHILQFDATALPAGIYLCTLQTTHTTQTHKITVFE